MCGIIGILNGENADKSVVNGINKGRFVANCEIYNWKELNKKYNLKAKNDSEVLFRLIENNENIELALK